MTRATIAAATALLLLCGLDLVFAERWDSGARQRQLAEVAALRAEIAAREPQLVLLGDSMLGEGVDEVYLSELAGVRALKVHSGGAASAWCYLALKNLILAADPPPARVAIFFRDHHLTEPRFRSQGSYRERLAALSEPEEPLLEQLALAPADPTLAFLRREIPFYDRREALRSRLHVTLMDRVGRHFFGLAPGAAEATLLRVFADGALDARQLGSRQLEAEHVSDHDLDFQRDIARSFLPEMLRLVDERGVRLVFVRVKRRRDLVSEQEPPGVVRHVGELAAWLRERGIPLLDFTHDPRIRHEHYAAGDHLSRGEGRRVFTELLAEALAPELAEVRSR